MRARRRGPEAGQRCRFPRIAQLRARVRVAREQIDRDTARAMSSAADMPPPERSILFVCMGNICRSPTAAGVFRAAIAQQGLADSIRVDSAGTGDWHVGSPPDRRAIDSAHRRGYDLARMRARQVGLGDFARFGWILAMDRTNLRELEAMRPSAFAGPSWPVPRFRARSSACAKCRTRITAVGTDSSGFSISSRWPVPR